MARYSVRVLKGGDPVEGAEIVVVGERFYGVTPADGKVSVNLGAYNKPLGVHLLITLPDGAGEMGGGPYRLEPGVTKDIEV